MSVQEDRVRFPDSMARFDSLQAFYAANRLRERSGERDYGIYWWDGPQGYSDTWRISAVAATGEIYASRISIDYDRESTGESPVVVLGRIDEGNPGYTRSDLLLEGWNLVCGASFSLRWVIDRAPGADTDQLPASALSILCRHRLLGDHVHASVFVGKDEGERALAGELILRVDEWEFLKDGLERGFGSRVDLAEVVASAAL